MIDYIKLLNGIYMKRVCLNLIYTFLLFSYVSPVFGAQKFKLQMTLDGKVPDKDESLRNGCHMLTWNNVGTYTRTQNGNVTWKLENQRLFYSFCNGDITQKWSDGSLFSKDAVGNITIAIPNIGNYNYKCNGEESIVGLEQEQIDYIKKNGCIFDNENLDSYILPRHLLSNSKYSISDVLQITHSQNVQPQQQSIERYLSNNSAQVIDNSPQIIDSRFDKSTKEHREKRQQRITQNETIKANVETAKRASVSSFVEFTDDFNKVQKDNVLFLDVGLDASYVNSNDNSTLKFMGKMSWLASAVSYQISFKKIKAYMMDNKLTNLTFFPSRDQNLSAAKCWNEIKDEKKSMVILTMHDA